MSATDHETRAARYVLGFDDADDRDAPVDPAEQAAREQMAETVDALRAWRAQMDGLDPPTIVRPAPRRLSLVRYGSMAAAALVLIAVGAGLWLGSGDDISDEVATAPPTPQSPTDEELRALVVMLESKVGGRLEGTAPETDPPDGLGSPPPATGSPPDPGGPRLGGGSGHPQKGGDPPKPGASRFAAPESLPSAWSLQEQSEIAPERWRLLYTDAAGKQSLSIIVWADPSPDRAAAEVGIESGRTMIVVRSNGLSLAFEGAVTIEDAAALAEALTADAP